MSSSQSNLHTLPVAVGSGVAGIGAVVAADQLVKAAQGPHMKSHLAKAVAGAAVAASAFEFTKGLAEDDDAPTKHCDTRRHHHHEHAESHSGSHHGRRGLLAAPVKSSAVTVNVGAVPPQPTFVAQTADSVEEFSEESDEEVKVCHLDDHRHCHHKRHRRHRSRSPDKHHRKHQLEEVIGAYGVVKELLGDKHHHALHMIEGLVGAHGAMKETQHH